MLKAVRLVLVALVALLAIPAATVHAATQMPIGFFDDPVVPLVADRAQNLQLAAVGRRVGHPHDRQLGRDRADEAGGSPSNGDDPAYKLDRPRRARLSGGPLQPARDDQHHRHAEVGERRQDAERHAEEARRPDDVREDARHAVQRRAPGTGRSSLWSVWNEPNLQLFLTPQFVGKKIVGPANYAKLYKAAYAGIKAGNPLAKVAIGETSARGRDKPLPGVSATIAPGTFAQLLSQVKGLKFDAWAHHPYPTSPNLPPMQKVRYPNVTLSTMPKFEKDLKKWFHRTVPIWITEYGHETKPAEPHGVTLAQQAAYAKQALTFAKNDPNVQMFIWFTFRDSAGNPWQSGLDRPVGRAQAGVRQLRRGRATDRRLDEHGRRPARPSASRCSCRTWLTTRQPGASIGMTYLVYNAQGKAVAVGQPTATLAADQSVTFTPAFVPAKGQTYTGRRDAERGERAHTSRARRTSRSLELVGRPTRSPRQAASTTTRRADRRGDAGRGEQDARRGRDRGGAEQQEVHQQRGRAERSERRRSVAR